jgi:(5-formylfuran-3-yl)methyl phosphate synthase
LQLLVSVRSADEVGPALAGGADIIDAKEPNRGSLGAVDPDVLSRILRRVPDDCGVSVALGDPTAPEQVVAAFHGLELLERTSPIYLKMGFAGVRSSTQIGRLLETAVSLASVLPATPRIVAVAYADRERAGTIPPALIASIADAAGAAGVLLDTHGKDGRGLLEWLTPDALVEWVGLGRQAGLLTALAGSLLAWDLPLVCQAQPDVIGVRGAACSGGRLGLVSKNRVRRFREALERAVRETRDTGAISFGSTAAKSRKLKA